MSPTTERTALEQALHHPAASAIVRVRQTKQRTQLVNAKAANVAAEQNYTSQGVLALAARDPAAVLALGFVHADEASPSLQATFTTAEGGTRLVASSRFLGRLLKAKQAVELNRLYISSAGNVFQVMEHFGEAMSQFSAQPVYTGPTSLWCSWYAHRMEMTEDKVLANATVAARHFKPLGLEIMQLDHGWQQGDITGADFKWTIPIEPLKLPGDKEPVNPGTNQ